MDYDTVRTWIATISGVGATLTVLLYLTLPWWRWLLGKGMFFDACALAIMFDLISFARWTDRGRDDLLFAIVYGVVMVGIWVKLIAYLLVRRRGGIV